MKKIVAITMAAIMAISLLSLIGCGKRKNAETSDSSGGKTAEPPAVTFYPVSVRFNLHTMPRYDYYLSYNNFPHSATLRVYFYDESLWEMIFQEVLEIQANRKSVFQGLEEAEKNLDKAYSSRYSDLGETFFDLAKSTYNLCYTSIAGFLKMRLNNFESYDKKAAAFPSVKSKLLAQSFEITGTPDAQMQLPAGKYIALCYSSSDHHLYAVASIFDVHSSGDNILTIRTEP